MSAGAVARFRKRVRTGPRAQVLPFLRAIEFDAVGNIWVEPFPRPGSGPGAFLIFGTEGRWLGGVRLPAGLDRGTHASTAPQLEIGDDYVLGVWRDELGLEMVRLYEILKR